MRVGTLHNKNDDSVKEWEHFLKARKPENQKTRPGRASFPETVKTQKKQFRKGVGTFFYKNNDSVKEWEHFREAKKQK